MYLVKEFHTQAKQNTAILLAFVADDQPECQWFKEQNLTELDKTRNEYMVWHNGSWYCPKTCKDEKMRTWIKVFLPFNVSIDTAEWDTVKKLDWGY